MKKVYTCKARISSTTANHLEEVHVSTAIAKVSLKIKILTIVHRKCTGCPKIRGQQPNRKFCQI